VLRVI